MLSPGVLCSGADGSDDFGNMFESFFGGGGGGGFPGGDFGGGGGGFGGGGPERAQPPPELYPKGSKVAKLSEAKFPKKGSAHVWLVRHGTENATFACPRYLDVPRRCCWR